MNAFDKQEGGSHYKDLPIQPAQYIHANGIGFFEGNVIKYVTRWRDKGGLGDLKKAKHYIELLIELEFPIADKEASKYQDMTSVMELVIPIEEIRAMNVNEGEARHYIRGRLVAAGMCPEQVFEITANSHGDYVCRWHPYKQVSDVSENG